MSEAQKLEWKELWAAMKAQFHGERNWVETTEEMYDDQLCALPPVIQIPGAFLMGEPWSFNAEDKHVYAAFKRVGKQYFAKYMSASEFSKEFKANQTVVEFRQ